jgi:hypothetical protein
MRCLTESLFSMVSMAVKCRRCLAKFLKLTLPFQVAGGKLS